MKMKTELMKIKKRSLKTAQNEHRALQREEDLKKLIRAVWLSKHRILAFFAAWFGIRTFDWARRYENNYMIGWARRAGWRPSRLIRAMGTVDQEIRVRANRIIRVRDAVRRRARNIAKFSRFNRRKNLGDGVAR